jgi:Thymidylate synthase
MNSGHFDIYDPRVDYPRLLEHVLQNGHESSPRGDLTYEMFDVVMRLDPHYVLVDGINRGISLKLISMEALQLIAGVSYPFRTIAAAPNMARFTDGEIFHGAYGTRVRPQLPGVIERLKSDRDSRQAVITVWDPLHDLFGNPQPKDVPCTTMLQFFIREDRLIMHVTMRSNDVWWGTPHDWGQFSQLQLALANVLDVEPGEYYHHAVSLHMYARDVDKLEPLTSPTAQFATRLDGIGMPGNSLVTAQKIARRLLDGEKVLGATTAEKWHYRQQQAITELINA